MRKRSWRGPLAELAIVFVGVLVALAADSWWQNLTDQTRLRANLDALRSDLHEARVAVKSAIAVDSMTVQRATVVLTALTDDGPYDDDVVVAYDSIFSIGVGLIPYGTLRYLVGSGDMRLLRNREAREALIEGLALIERNDQINFDLAAEARDAVTTMNTARLGASKGGSMWLQEVARDPRFTASLMTFQSRVSNIIALLLANLEAIERMDAAISSTDVP